MHLPWGDLDERPVVLDASHGLRPRALLLPPALTAFSCEGQVQRDGMGMMGAAPPPELADGRLSLKTTLTGLDLLLGKKSEDMAKEMMKGLPAGLGQDGVQLGPSEGEQEKHGPYLLGDRGGRVCPAGLVPWLRRVGPCAIASTVVAITGVVSLTLLKSQVTNDMGMDTEVEMPGVSLGLNWLYGYMAAIALLVLAVPTSIFLRLRCATEPPALSPTAPSPTRWAPPRAVPGRGRRSIGPAGAPVATRGGAAPGAGNAAPPMRAADDLPPVYDPRLHRPQEAPDAAAAAGPQPVQMRCPNPACGRPRL